MAFEGAFRELAGTHDLRLSAWGPYTKRHMGISHIPDPDVGVRFDLSVFPGLYRRSARPPSVLWESGYHPWEATPDLSFVRCRHEVVWKDQVYVDLDTCRLDGNSVLIWAHCVNTTADPQNLAIHWMASLHPPTVGGRGSAMLTQSRVSLPDDGVWVEALDYAALALGDQPHRANLTYDGLVRGEVRVAGFVRGLGLGQGFGASTGDAVVYRVVLPAVVEDAVMVLRYRLPPETTMRLELPGLLRRRVRLHGNGELMVQEIPLRQLLSGEVTVTLAPMDAGTPLELDGFALLPAAHANALGFHHEPWQLEPKRWLAPRADSLVLRYPDVGTAYGFAWGVQTGEPVQSVVREFRCHDIDTTLLVNAHDHVRRVIEGSGNGHYTSASQRPLFLEPQSTRVVIGLVCCGDTGSVQARLADFDARDPVWAGVHSAAYAQVAGSFADAKPSGRPVKFGQERMAATLLTNVVYPVRTRGAWIRHYTPGRWWDSLYTWDSGFIGLGLSELDLERALDNLNAYLTAPGTEDAAFIHHGSPVPTQFYVFQALWDQTQSLDLAQYTYPRLQQYYRFLGGRLGSSNTRTLRSGLIRTWDYFYNSGGWDDYPAQLHVHAYDLCDSVAPVISTAQVIRIAKILRNVASLLGEPVREYEEDIALLSDALQSHSWDEESGYFGYVTHDGRGAPTGVLRHADGANYNMGLDGVSPLVAGICTPEQESRIVKALMSSDHFWSPCGLTTVDQSAPYYREDGYWNGGVWMPHQWLIWKALLDLGMAEAAHRIATTALKVWQAEVARSYNCHEHFIARTGRGAGWHQFGGLSAPVLNWFATYHRAGRLTVGFDTWISSATFTNRATALRAALRHTGAQHRAPTVVVSLAPGIYAATWNGGAVPFDERYPGTLEIQLPAGHWEGELAVTPL